MKKQKTFKGIFARSDFPRIETILLGAIFPQIVEFSLRAKIPQYIGVENMNYNDTDILPYDHISCGVSKKWLWQELQKAKQGITTLDCRQGPCNGCGICPTLQVDQVYVKRKEND